jgi:hypothetical protein
MGNQTWPPQPLIGCDILNFFFRLAQNKISPKNCRNIFGEVLIKCCCFLYCSENPVWPPGPLIGRNILDFFSLAVWNFMKLNINKYMW